MKNDLDDWLPVLRCPVSGQPLRRADRQALRELEQLTMQGRVRTPTGQVVTIPPREALVREDDLGFYPVDDGIPLLLTENLLLVGSPPPRSGQPGSE